MFNFIKKINWKPLNFDVTSLIFDDDEYEEINYLDSSSLDWDGDNSNFNYDVSEYYGGNIDD